MAGCCKHNHSISDRFGHEVEENRLDWNSDNCWFIVNVVLPNIKLSSYDAWIVQWAYKNGWEAISDGETVVKDEFLDGKIKSPAGVCHDAINRVKDHTTPDGHKWTPSEANALYRRIAKGLDGFDGSYPFWRRWIRWWGVMISWREWWR